MAPSDTDMEPNFSEIRRMLDELPPADRAAEAAAGTAAGEGMGMLSGLARFLAAWQGRATPQLNHPRICVFAASQGVAAGLGVDPSALTEASVKRFLDGDTPLNRLVDTLDADLRVYELSVEVPTENIAAQPAMSEADCARAMTYGMIAVEPGIDVLALAGVSGEAKLPAAALASLLLGGTARDWLGADAGSARLALVDQAVALHAGAKADPLEALRRLGGLDIAAMAGAILACRFARTPVLIDGVEGLAAAAVLRALRPTAIEHCLLAHASGDAGARALADRLGLTPLLDLGLSTGDGIGSAIAINLLRAAVACQAEAARLN
ncbi:nicotinate-nucleotide--dimethylbenzimidazole phosphoribosyltransferase [Oceanibaculum pacificum]|uniref:Uncharacterized protein n=1 Tax=Oceanibaculum pacificum TaxID=580166 RepID=A0A154WH41_9PROT|nr:nicotinate-nucleotide--dimethylbenzimidazole phosphoribosyltransferase [Oceanibaculum pacificum]KZD12789.1 hypothetical protein AUP43_00150 [Oceanibaculum pacificum]